MLVIFFRRYDNFVMNVVKVQEDAIYLTLLFYYVIFHLCGNVKLLSY